MKKIMSFLVAMLTIMLFASSATAINELPLVVKNGETVKICARQSYIPEVTKADGSSSSDYEWSSSDEDILWVRADGSVMGVGIGTATLTGKAKDGTGNKVKVKLTIPKVYTTHDSITIDTPDGVEFGYAFNISGFLSVSHSGKCFTTERMDDVGEIDMTRIMPVKAGTGSIIFQSSGRTIKTVNITVKKSAFEVKQTPDDVSALSGSAGYAIANKSVNIRKEPSTKSDKMGSVKKGEKLTVTQAFYTDGWHQIKYGGKICYVSAEFCNIIEN